MLGPLGAKSSTPPSHYPCLP